MNRLDEIIERERKATRGPWRWNLNLKSKHLYLEACISGFEYVMDFVRWGMSGASARFKLGDQPDADFIAHAREDVPWLINEVRRLRGQDEENVLVCIVQYDDEYVVRLRSWALK